MNRNELEVAAEERLFDAMLEEVVREHVPESRGVGGVRGWRSHWFAAAMVLFGVTVVAGVFVVSQAQKVVAVVPQEPEQDPLPRAVKVLGLAELLALDMATANVTLQFQKQEDLAAFGRFTKLRALQLEPDPEMSHEGFQSAWSLAPLAECKSLETISIGYFGALNPTELSVLTRLPKLQSLTLVGRDKVVDAALGSLLGKLPLRSLVLHAVAIEPEGLRALGELPLLERLELRDCVGLEKCDLQHLYQLRQLHSLSLRGPRYSGVNLDPSRVGDGNLVPPEILGEDVRLPQFITAQWMRGLAKALPNLRELDLSESRIDDDVLTALPRRLTSIRLENASGFGGRGVGAVAELAELESLACSDPQPPVGPTGMVTIVTWKPLLQRRQLRRFEYTGFVDLLVDELGKQEELRELRLYDHAFRVYSFREGNHEVPKTVNLEVLARLPRLVRVELVGFGPALEQALRTALPARVHFEILPR